MKGMLSVVNLFLLILHLKVDNTDAEGRLLLADALCYAHCFNGRAIVNAATLTGKQPPFFAHFASWLFLPVVGLWISCTMYIKPT